ncbi:MAG: type II toxin-antitoxin system VapC family toxin [bacterium]
MEPQGVVVDIDVIIHYLRSQDKADTVFGRALTRYKCYTTCITEYEIYIGAKSNKHLKDADDIFRVLEVIPTPYGCAKMAAGELNRLLNQGIQVDAMDALIAGICLFHGLPLLTENRRHFENFAGLNLINL